MVKPFTLAVDVGGSHITVALVTDAGIRAHRCFDIDAGLGLRRQLAAIEQATKELWKDVPAAVGQCAGIGMALPLLVDAAAGRVTSAPRGKFADAPEIEFAAWAADRFDLPVKLEADAHAGCLGEWLYGAGAGCDDLVFVTLGTGYGSSVILRGRPLRGRSSQAGLLGGHLSVNVGGHSCVCPGRGCVEAETGTWALTDLAREQPQYSKSRLAKHDPINYRILMDEADCGDELVKAILERSLTYWGASLVNLTHAYNPERIVMAGGVLKAADRIIPFMNDTVRRQVWTASGYPAVVVAQHVETAALIGCRALFAKAFECL